MMVAVPTDRRCARSASGRAPLERARDVAQVAAHHQMVYAGPESRRPAAQQLHAGLRRRMSARLSGDGRLPKKSRTERPQSCGHADLVTWANRNITLHAIHGSRPSRPKWSERTPRRGPAGPKTECGHDMDVGGPSRRMGVDKDVVDGGRLEKAKGLVWGWHGPGPGSRSSPGTKPSPDIRSSTPATQRDQPAQPRIRRPRPRVEVTHEDRGVSPARAATMESMA